MKFIVDAQLPRRLARELSSSGHDALHSLDLPDGNRTADEIINKLAAKDGRIVITKDADFVTSFPAAGHPTEVAVGFNGQHCQ